MGVYPFQTDKPPSTAYQGWDRENGDMNDSTLRVLREADSPEYYYPLGFNYEARYSEIKALVPELENISNLKFSASDPVGFQDGTLFTRLSVVAVIPRANEGVGGARHIRLLSFEFASFGRLFTGTKVIDAGVAWQGMISVISRAGFVYIPWEDLKEEYSGNNDSFDGETWRMRYFADAN